MATEIFGKTVLTQLEEWVDPKHAAIIVVDVQNDFCAPGGNIGQRGMDMQPLQDMITAISKLLDGARRAGVRIIYTQHTLHADCFSESPAYLAYRMGLHDGKLSVLCIDGTWGHEICGEVQPEPGEIIVRKHRQSPWIGADLDQILRANGITTIIATGTMTSACVDWTARYGVQLDYYVVVPEDCVSQADMAGHCAAMDTLRRYLPKGGVTTSDSLLNVWSAVTAP